MKIEILLAGLLALLGHFVLAKEDLELEKYRPYESFVELVGGEFMMGINDRDGVNYEYPQRKAIAKPFRIHLYPVTVASFKKFKNAKTRHSTDAENAGNSWVFRNLLNDKAKIHRPDSAITDEDDIDALRRNMVQIEEARWNRPEGGDSKIKDKLNYPVVHVSYNDAHAYCAWKRMRLPTEIEWEFAARGGLKNKIYPWGDNWIINRTNLWQGKYPDDNQLRDGHYGLSPVDAFPYQNKYEMYDVIGNIWEWTSTIYRDLHVENVTSHKRSLKGGSFLDTRDGEDRANKMKIRLSTRIGLRKNFTAQNIGFRCVQPLKKEELTKIPSQGFRVVRLRPPIHFHLNHKQSHFLHDKKDEL